MELRIIEKWLNMLLELLFPRRCPICDEIVVPKGQLVCPGCKNLAEVVEEPKCKQCGKEISSIEKEYCYDCQRTKRSYHQGWALFHYTDVMKTSISRFKYKNKREYADWYSEEILKRYGKKLSGLGADALIPVPLHPGKRRKRGFNQAELLAKRLGRGTGIPVCADALLRLRNTAPQKQLGPRERLKNLERAFRVDRSRIGKAETVILVDDIYTTGSTIEACTRVLQSAGVKRVYFISICIGKGY